MCLFNICYSAFRDYLRWYIARIKMGVSPTNPKQQAAIPFFGHTKILHMLVSMGSTALALLLSYPGMVA